ncbi:putative low choriolytic enzyme-like isoform 5 [Scophthalmus maximus]|uniref:Metalloendopeptidase n=1 Tax=Scophthalmus maximus TaxID=52904 RepID=A0A2U9BBD2_SCOMX|nr:putative low choriolytic enzyme-like [Scophthalmus maximus]AWP01135.1 putative low choriolytic enzyme-like isoform 4 [Scophthalmus maximus]AWP01136.1 putative low choriolytic enzyme-like isoform 5 [Scophthalmus maximus]
MTRVLLVLLVLSLTAIPPGAADEVAQTDESQDVSEIIAKVNDGIPNLVHGDVVPNRRRNAASCTAYGCKWPKSGRYVYVPITISSAYSRAQRNFIIRSLVSFHGSTCIRFVWRRWYHWTYLNFFSGSGCWSSVGRRWFGRQSVSLKKNGCLYTSTVQHEVLHALGFHHEHIRSDRDSYVNILTQNIQSGKQQNFRKMRTNNLATRYDFNSVMQYSNNAFSKNGQPTIVAKSNPNLKFGNARQMSANDIARVNRLYRCW